MKEISHQREKKNDLPFFFSNVLKHTLLTSTIDNKYVKNIQENVHDVMGFWSKRN